MTLGYSSRLADYPYVLVRVECRDCDLFRCFRLTRLVARYGCEIDLCDVLGVVVGECPRWHAETMGEKGPCEAHLPDLRSDSPPDLPPGAPPLRLVE